MWDRDPTFFCWMFKLMMTATRPYQIPPVFFYLLYQRFAIHLLFLLLTYGVIITLHFLLSNILEL